MKILKIHTIEKGYSDPEHMLLHASFQLLVNFIEGKNEAELVDWSWRPDHQAARDEMQALYDWWKNDYPNRKDPVLNKKIKAPPFRTKKLPDGNHQVLPYDKVKYKAWDDACEESARLEVVWFEEEQEMLRRLIAIRKYLWS